MSDRENSFEKMLAGVLDRYGSINRQLEELKAAEKTKTATYRELLGERMFYKRLVTIYRAYGLID